MKYLIAAAIMMVLVYGAYDYGKCEAYGGKYVRGLFLMECIND